MNALLDHNGQTSDQKVLIEQIKLLDQKQLSILAIMPVVGAAMVYGLWDVASRTALTIWISLVLIVVVIRVAIYFFYRRQINHVNTQWHIRYFIIVSAVSGCIFGFGTAMLFPTQGLEYQIFIIFVLAGMGAGSMSSLTAYLPAYFAYFPISILPVCIKLFLVGGQIQTSMGIMAVVYIVSFSFFGIKIGRAHKQSLGLRFENIELVEQLREQKNAAELANIAKSKFLAAASHDLRQPLYALTLFTSVLDESNRSPKERRVVDQIKASVGALQDLFNALLDISQLDAGVMKVDKSDFYLQPVFNKLDNEFAPQAKIKGLTILWPSCPYAIHSDQTLFEQIMRNFISNAIRYTNRGEVRITCDVDDEMLNINIIDTGIGIPLDEQQSIFGEFFQLGNPERDRNKGLGLGLAIVQRTAGLIGHPIEVVSQPGVGSTFSIKVERATMIESINKATPIAEKIIPPNGTLIIVIDDEASVREGTQSLLERWDCDVITAADQQEAMTQLRRQANPPDGIIADYRLRENQTGIDAIRAIHAEYNHDIPALIVTGDIAVEHLREVNNSGFQVLHKPVAPAKLRAFLRNAQSRKLNSITTQTSDTGPAVLLP